MIWRTGRYVHDLGAGAVVMGILNVTPDSFSDRGDFMDVSRAVDRALAMFTEGAALVDIGGESTRPGAPVVPLAEELSRVVPVVERILAAAPSAVLSIDTSKAEVARAALAAGASVINDVTAMRGDPRMAEAVAEYSAGLVLMHMQGDPRTMQHNPSYQDVVAEVATFLRERRQHALGAGIAPECVALDPGIGFGKTVEHNLTLLKNLGRFTDFDAPVLLGASRKSFLGKVTGAESMPDRLWPTLATTALGRAQGVRIFRVHDVRPNLSALRLAEAVINNAAVDLKAGPEGNPVG